MFNDALPPKDQQELTLLDYTTPPRVKGAKKDTTTVPRVETRINQPTDSIQPTSPQSVLQTPIVHKRHTRNNKPAIIKPDDDQPTVLQPPQRQQSQHINVRTPMYVSQHALNHLVMLSENYSPLFTPRKLQQQSATTFEPVCNAVIHPITGESITNYKKLLHDPTLKTTWEESMCKELGRLAQGYRNTQGTNMVNFMNRDQIKTIPTDLTITYARIVVDYRPQKADPNRVRITAGGNLITYPFELTTRTADLPTSKILWNSTISTKNARYMCIDIKNMYLATPMDRHEYMRMPINLIPDKIIRQYALNEKCKNGFVYMEIICGMYGLPQAGILANKLLRQRLELHGYYEVEHTPGLWRHRTLPIQFTLVVDDFGVKYINKENALHLINALKDEYEIKTDWKGQLYCGISLDWNYEQGFVDTKMPGYAMKQIKKYKHKLQKRRNTPLQPLPRKYGKAAQEPIPEDTSKPLNEKDKKIIEQVVGSFLFYRRAVDPLILHALNTIANNQNNPTEKKHSNKSVTSLTTWRHIPTQRSNIMRQKWY